MLKKILLSTVFFACNFSFSEEILIPNQSLKLEFTNSKFNEIKFDPTSEKTPLEQLLDLSIDNHDIELKTPYRNTTILSFGKRSNFIQAITPHRADIPFDYTKELHTALMNSDLLIACVYRQAITHQDSPTVYNLSKYGYWKCDRNICYELNSNDLRQSR